MESRRAAFISTPATAGTRATARGRTTCRTAFFSPSPFNLPNGVFFTIAGTGSAPYFRDNGVQLADMNGDGRVDIVQSLFAGGTPVKHVWLNDGAGFTPADAWNLPDVLTVTNDGRASRPNGLLADMNGDGLA